MKIKVAFTHHKKHKLEYVSISSFHFGDDSSTGPVIPRGDKPCVWVFDVKEGDTLEFATTKFEDEFDLFHKRRKRVVNGISEAQCKRDHKRFEKRVKAGKYSWLNKDGSFKKECVIDPKKLSPRERKKLKRSMKIAAGKLRQFSGAKKKKKRKT